MQSTELHAVTGAFGFSGKYIAQRLLDRGHRVITLTNSPDRENAFNGKVKAFPFDFENIKALTNALKDVDVLYNTYWVRFNHKTFTHSVAVTNTLNLFKAAEAAGVKRIVHISITNPDINSPLEYFKDKALLEKALMDSGISWSILRPAVIFGDEDILVNNIAWFLRNLPVFGIPGDGSYGIQPVFVEDLADMAVDAGAANENTVVNAVGPEKYTYREFVKTIGAIIGHNKKTVSMPPFIIYLTGLIAGFLKKDIIITKEELKGLMAGTLAVDTEPTGKTLISEWAKINAETLGKNYASELGRRKDRKKAYI